MNSNDIDLGPRRWWVRLFLGLDRLLIILAGGDPDMLQEGRAEDRRIVRLFGAILIAVWILQVWLWSLAAHQALAAPGAFHLSYVLFCALMATIVLLLDSVLVMRSGFFLHGEQELRLGGVDISGGWSLRAKQALLVGVRMLAGAGLAQLTALTLLLWVLWSDIRFEFERVFLAMNASIIESVRSRHESDIAGFVRALNQNTIERDAMREEMRRLAALVLDPPVDDAPLAAVRSQFERLQDNKESADARLAEAEIFATNELAGIRGTSGNTGIPGDGPVRAAAEERVRIARGRAQTARQEFERARDELQQMEAAFEVAVEEERQRARQRRDELVGELQAADARHSALSGQYRDLVDNREQTIRETVLRDPSHVEMPQGFLASMRALKTLAQDPGSFGFIVIFEAVGFTIELAAILAKLFGRTPTRYETRLVREHHIDACENAEVIHRWYEARDANRRTDDGPNPSDTSEAFAAPEPQAAPAEVTPSDPPKRKRGRPRKVKPPEELVPA